MSLLDSRDQSASDRLHLDLDAHDDHNQQQDDRNDQSQPRRCLVPHPPYTAAGDECTKINALNCLTGTN